MVYGSLFHHWQAKSSAFSNLFPQKTVMTILRRKDLNGVRVHLNCPHLKKINLVFLCKCYWELCQTGDMALTDELLTGWNTSFKLWTSFKTGGNFSSRMHKSVFLTMHKVTLRAFLEFVFGDPQKNHSSNIWDILLRLGTLPRSVYLQC